MRGNVFRCTLLLGGGKMGCLVLKKRKEQLCNQITKKGKRKRIRTKMERYRQTKRSNVCWYIME
eukprot:UN10750